MKTLNQYYLQQRIAVLLPLVFFFLQQSTAQTYLNINFSNSTNKYSVLTDVSSITFDESGGMIVKKTDNSVSTETMNLINSITLDGTSGGGTALPVELASFTGSTSKGFVELHWKTATELNNVGFEIERTIDNGKLKMDNWITSGFVEGSGTSNAPKEYSYSDKGLQEGKYSYRLKQIDRDGKFSYSHAVEVTINNAPKEFALQQNYPNPFNPTTAIGYQLSVSGITTLKIFDALGREVATLVNDMKEAGTYSVSFDGSKLSSGIYFARLQSGEKLQLKKMVMLK